MSFQLYLVTNRVNGKRYVGQTTGTIQGRWKCHLSKALVCNSQYPIHAAIRKYGEEAFTVEPLYFGAIRTKAELDAAEVRAIATLETTTEGHGYNATFGGDGSLTAASRKKISDAIKAQWADPVKRQQMLVGLTKSLQIIRSRPRKEKATRVRKRAPSRKEIREEQQKEARVGLSAFLKDFLG
jgi:group I intron endonuclease